jgi:hypothetical protein
MKKITTVLVGLALSAAANANQHDLSHRFYAGINLGGSAAVLSSTGKKIQTATGQSFKTSYFAGDVHFGKRFGHWGLELSGGLLNRVYNSFNSGTVVLKAMDYLVALDLGYYFNFNEVVSFRPTIGLGGMFSQNTVTLGNGGSTALQNAEGNFASTDSFMGYTKAQVASFTSNSKNTNTTFKVAPKIGAAFVFAVHSHVSLTVGANAIWPISNKTEKFVFNGNVGANYHF